MADLSDEELRRQSRVPTMLTDENADGLKPFPYIIEAIRRQTGLTLHPTQVMGAIAMRQGRMIEMATGEGKTLTALLAAAAYAIGGQRVHVMTANRYLAKRDAELAAAVVARLDLTVGHLPADSSPQRSLPQYRRHLLYTTLYQVGFDWLRDRQEIERTGDRPTLPQLPVALVDEADMLLIDEARTPMILSEGSTAGPEYARLYRWAHRAAAGMRVEVDFIIPRRDHVELLAPARAMLREAFGLDPGGQAQDALVAALRARLFYRRDVDYIVDRNKVIIVDPKTGRRMPNRRWPGGLHDAVAVRDRLPLTGPTHHSAQVSVQHFIAQYRSLCGCSGTIANAAREMWSIYGVETLAIPTHRKCIRRVHRPEVYTTPAEQFRAVARHVDRAQRNGRAVLIGTTHVRTSERLAHVLRRRDIPHQVLNAHHEDQEAAIVAQAGQPGRVTIATNMAGRGTDIKLHPDVRDAGGLEVISMQMHESARIDRQLVGRCARQGDPGSARFVLSLQDPLLFEHAGDERLRHRPRRRVFGRPIRSRRVLRLWRRVQRTVESRHREARIALIERSKSLTQLFGKPTAG